MPRLWNCNLKNSFYDFQTLARSFIIPPTRQSSWRMSIYRQAAVFDAKYPARHLPFKPFPITGIWSLLVSTPSRFLINIYRKYRRQIVLFGIWITAREQYQPFVYGAQVLPITLGNIYIFMTAYIYIGGWYIGRCVCVCSISLKSIYTLSLYNKQSQLHHSLPNRPIRQSQSLGAQLWVNITCPNSPI